MKLPLPTRSSITFATPAKSISQDELWASLLSPVFAHICFSGSKKIAIIIVMLPRYTVLVAGASTWILGYHLQLGKFTSLLNPFPLQKNDNDSICPYLFCLGLIRINETWMEAVWAWIHKSEELCFLGNYLGMFVLLESLSCINTFITLSAIITKFKDTHTFTSCHAI